MTADEIATFLLNRGLTALKPGMTPAEITTVLQAAKAAGPLNQATSEAGWTERIQVDGNTITHFFESPSELHDPNAKSAIAKGSSGWRRGLKKLCGNSTKLDSRFMRYALPNGGSVSTAKYFNQASPLGDHLYIIKSVVRL